MIACCLEMLHFFFKNGLYKTFTIMKANIHLVHEIETIFNTNYYKEQFKI